ncbi:MAG TPA: M28 family metallopeptidase [Chitinophagaceae bacterium]|nr:M28 family metallopeptidase [Chitinophagaceae bacterium]
MQKLFLFFTTFYFVAVNAQIKGFSVTGATTQVALEKKFDQQLKASNVDLFMKEMTARPHHVGSPGGKAVAEYIYNKFKSWGFQTEIETFYVLFPTPKTRLLEMIGAKKFTASLKEPVLKEDATSGQVEEQLPVYNCWSADGDVTGELVFVNYGLPADYEQLEKMGIDVKGKIVIAKYGKSWRGIKPKVAQEHGAIGCIIYSDPYEDGYYQGDVYPKGPFRNEYGAQRGSVEDMPVYPGDPLTPGIGATKDAKRLDRKDAANLLKIPVIPVSYADAKPLLESLEGPVAPAEWRGALPLTYHVGPSKSKVHLKLEFDWQIRPINNIIAKLPGSELPDQWVIRGNHHDAWVNGATDPISGQAAMMEEARAIGELAKTGWRPKRTMIYCAWDAEEPGLLGSTEWAEYHADELKQKAVIYINTDGYTRGFVEAEGSHALEPFFTEITKDVMDPQTGVTVFQRRKSREAVSASSLKTKKELIDKKDFELGALGSGSDYSPFIQHLGIPSMDINFSGEGEGGDYHSIYDSYDMFRRFKDPTFEYGVTLAKTTGRIALRMANAEMLPFDFYNLQKKINGYLTEVMNLVEQTRENTNVENRLIKEKFYSLAADPTKPLAAPQPKEEVPYLSFASLQNAMNNLDKICTSLTTRLDNPKLTTEQKNNINSLLYQAEQHLLLKNGLPRRDWYKHSIYAPGFYTGYGVKTLPGIREAIEQRNWKEAQEQIELVAEAINTFSSYLDSIK